MSSKSAIAIAELRSQAVAKEIERKANAKRLKWFEENYKRVYENPAIPKEKIPKKAAVLYDELIKMRKERFEADRRLKSLPKYDIRQQKCPESEDYILDIMYPVLPEVKRTLYEGVSHDEEGRYKYLKLRNKDNPHDKFRHKETSGFEYGWRIQETGESPRKDHCRINTWHRRVNGALNVDDLQRRPPYPAGHINFPLL